MIRHAATLKLAAMLALVLRLLACSVQFFQKLKKFIAGAVSGSDHAAGPSSSKPKLWADVVPCRTTESCQDFSGTLNDMCRCATADTAHTVLLPGSGRPSLGSGLHGEAAGQALAGPKAVLQRRAAAGRLPAPAEV